MNAIKNFTLGEVQASEVKLTHSTLEISDLDEYAVLRVHSEKMVLDGVGIDHHLEYILVTGA